MLPGAVGPSNSLPDSFELPADGAGSAVTVTSGVLLSAGAADSPGGATAASARATASRAIPAIPDQTTFVFRPCEFGFRLIRRIVVTLPSWLTPELNARRRPRGRLLVLSNIHPQCDGECGSMNRLCVIPDTHEDRAPHAQEVGRSAAQAGSYQALPDKRLRRKTYTADVHSAVNLSLEIAGRELKAP